MAISFRWLLVAASALACLSSHPVLAAPGLAVTVSAVPGTVVRWTKTGTTRCGMKGRSWAALHGICYYPIDLLQTPALITIARWGNGLRELAHISVVPSDYGTESIDLPDIPQANPSPEDLKRDSRDGVLLSKVWSQGGTAEVRAAPRGAGQPAAEGQFLRCEARLQRQAGFAAPHWGRLRHASGHAGLGRR